MAWRWQPIVLGRSKLEAIRDYRAATGCALKDAKDHVEANPHLFDPADERKGYCGFAGKPEA